MNLLRILLVMPVTLLVAVFAIDNRQPVTLGLWPSDVTVDAPLSLLLLVGVALGFAVGLLAALGGNLRQRRRARAAERRARLLAVQAPMPSPAPMPALATGSLASMPVMAPLGSDF